MSAKTLISEKECPECGKKLDWKLVHNGWGSPQVNGLCINCNIVFRGREAPEITKGKQLERDGETRGVNCMDKRITCLPCDVQIGILRQRQIEEENWKFDKEV